MSSARKIKTSIVVPISVKTGKELKRSPRRGQSILYALKGIRGALKILHPTPQAFFKKDLKGLNKIVVESGKNNFVAYEQKLRYPVRDKKGKIQYRVTAKGEKKKLYQTKITYAKPKSKTKPILFKKGKKLRALDLKFASGNYTDQNARRNLILLKPNAKIHSQVLTGETIKQALSNIQVDVNMAKVRKHGFNLYYNIHLLLTSPGKETIKVPINSAFIDREFSKPSYHILKKGGDFELFGRSKVKIVADLQVHMARSVRYALKNTGDGYAFTELTTLESIETKVREEVSKFELSGEVAKADKLAESIKWLYFKNKKRYFKKASTKLINLKSGYTVTMYVKFEVLDE